MGHGTPLRLLDSMSGTRVLVQKKKDGDQEALDEEVSCVLAEGLGPRGVVVPFEHRELLVAPVLKHHQRQTPIAYANTHNS